MKFWETVSAFRDDRETLQAVFNNEKWRVPYGDWYAHKGELVRLQNRQILDSFLPIELTREIAARYHKMNFYYYPNRHILRVANRNDFPNEQKIAMTALEVHDQFGGSIIEEVTEYGSAYINENE